MPDRIRVLIADDHPLFREGVAHSLGGEPDFVIVGEASDGEEAYQLAERTLPDVLLMDITMPGMGGIESVRKVATDFPVIRIVMLTVSEDVDDLMGALRSGASGYILKGVGAAELAGAIRAVSRGEVWVSPALASNMLMELTHPRPADPFNQLTDREREILTLVGEGLTNREIGDRLYLAEKTIKHYMSNVLQKLQVRSRVEAALLAQRRSMDRE